MANLCDDLVVRVFNKLDLSDLFTVESVCRQWRRVARTRIWPRFDYYDTGYLLIGGRRAGAKMVGGWIDGNHPSSSLPTTNFRPFASSPAVVHICAH